MQSPDWQKGLRAAGLIVARGNYARGIGRLCLDAKHPLLFKVPILCFYVVFPVALNAWWYDRTFLCVVHSSMQAED